MQQLKSNKMKTKTEIRKHYDGLRSQVFKNHKAFFAFGDQFEKEKQEGVEYVSLGGGLVCPKENAKALAEELGILIRRQRKVEVETLGAKKIISSAFFNYETAYTGDESDMMEELHPYIKTYPNIFTSELISETIAECYKWDKENN